ncbi:MAG: zinc ribbon domain-containing protein [Bacillota bacterium]|nr:zinc ribbon domain-containing protein [Bacillota bacterium]
MNCKNCGAPLAEGTKFCHSCGAEVAEEVVQPRYEAQPQCQPSIVVQPQYQRPFTEQDLPEQYRPLSAWAYWGLSILYMVPIVGFVFMIVFSFNSGNIHRRNFTRSFWCWYIIIAVVCIISIAVGGGFLAAVAYDLY